MSVNTAIWFGFMGGFLTAWKFLPWIGERLYRREVERKKKMQNRNCPTELPGEEDG